MWAEVESLESLQSTGALVGVDGVSWMWGRATWGQPTSLPPAQASPQGENCHRSEIVRAVTPAEACIV